MAGLYEHIRMLKPLDESDFEIFMLILDRLHDAATAHRLTEVADMDQRQIAGWLQDIRFTTEEVLHVLDRSS